MAVAHKMMPSTCASAKIVATPGLMSTSNPSTKSPPPHECDGSLVHACPGATPSCRAASGYDPPRVPAIRTMRVWSGPCVLRRGGLVHSSERLRTVRTWPQSSALPPPQLQTRAPSPGARAARSPVRSVAPCRAARVARCLEGGATPAAPTTLGRQSPQTGRVSEPQRQPPGRLGCGLATVWSARSGSCSWRCRDGRAWSSSASMVSCLTDRTPGLTQQFPPASCELRTEPSATRTPRPTRPALT